MRLLLVEDNKRLSDSLRMTLEDDGYAVDAVYDGLDGEEMGLMDVYDIIILDIMLPGKDGIEVCRALRNKRVRTPVLMLTARDALESRVLGLDSGADDYLVKPFAPAELVARVHALLRRIEPKPESLVVSYKDVTLDPTTREASRGSLPLTLTLTEFKLLHLLLRHPRQVLERAQILSEVWGYDFGGDDNVLEIYIGYLRKKLETGDRSRLVHTVRGVGYVLREE